jgi:hypothetical protein
MTSKEKRYSSSILGAPVDTADRFGEMARYYHREAELCASTNAYFSACILAAVALEALLLSYCYVYEVFDVTREILYQRVTSRLRLQMQKEGTW